MRIAFVTTRPPFPIDTGGNIRTFHLLRHVAAVHPTTLVTAVEGEPDAEALATLQERIPPLQVRTTPVPSRNTRGRRVFRALGSAFDPLPYTWSALCHPRFRIHVRTTLEDEPFDVVHCDKVHIASLLGGLRRRAPR